MTVSAQAPLAISLMGPTASGKTALALALRQRFSVELISVDSSQVYRGMDIGTAKPTLEERLQAPHRLIDIRDPAESYSAADFCADALREMREITAAGRIPLLVGGTMFYFHALEYGLSDLPSADAATRARIAAEGKEQGWPALHARLEEIDPVTASRIDGNDAQRIQRALEIYSITGQAPSEVAQTSVRNVPEYRFIKIALWPDDRAVLHQRIAQRFHEMLERGLVGEVEALYRRGDLHAGLPSMRTVGYRQVWSYLTGDVNYNEMVGRSIAATRQLAKRQLTWLRRYPGVERVTCDHELPTSRVVELVQSITVNKEVSI